MTSTLAAFHQAGHAVIARHLGVPVLEVAAIDAEHDYGHCRLDLAVFGDGTQPDRVDSLALRIAGILIAQAGLAAEQRFASAALAGYEGDPIAVGSAGDGLVPSARSDSDLSDVLLHAQHLCDDDEERSAIYQWSDLHVKALVDRHWSEILRVADALGARGQLSRDDLDYILRPQ